MKNHIKNYIKIMGLAAVPFGTAQVHGDPTEYRIKVERKEDANAERYIVSFECLSGEYHREPKVIEIDWKKNDFPVRISPRFANSMVQVGDMKKTNEHIEERWGKQSEVYLFPFQVRRLTLGKKGKPIFADCFLSFIPKVVEGYERVVLFIKISCGGFHSLESLSATSDVPVVLASTRGSVCACTNNLCRGKKRLPS